MTSITKKKVLFLVPTTGFGGAELHTLTLAAHFADAGYAPTMAFPVSDGTRRLYQECVASGIKTIDMPIAQLLMASPSENIEEQSARLQARLPDGHFDAVVVAAPSPMSAAGLLDCLAKTNLPGICVFHLVPEALVIPEDARLAMLRCLRNNFRFVCVSEFSRDMLCQSLGLEPNDGFIDFIPNGVEVIDDDGTFDLKELIKNDDARTVVTVGRVHQQKGGRHLVEAIPLVLESIPEARFIWFGEGPQEEELTALARQLRVSHALFFAGYTELPASIMRSADVLALPTLYEGLSLTLLEAMHCGAAIVTTDASYQDRILTDGVHASIAPCRDATILAERIIALLQDSDLAASYRSNVKSLSKYYSQERMIEDYLACLNGLLQVPTLSPPPAMSALPVPATWVSFVEAESGEFSLHISQSRPEDSDSLGEALAKQSLMDPIESVCPRSGAIGIAFVFGSSFEILVEATAIESIISGGECPLGALLLDATQFDSSYQSSRAFQVYYAILNETTKLADPATLILVVSKLIEFQRRFGMDPFESARRLLKAPLCLAARALILEHLALHSAEKSLDDSQDPDLLSMLNSLGATRAERALFRAHFFRAGNQEHEARRHFQLYETLSDSTAVESNEGQDSLVFFAEHFNFPPLNGGDRRMLSLIEGYQDLGLRVHFCGITSQQNAAAKRVQAARMRKEIGVEVQYFQVSDKVAEQLKEAHRDQSFGHDAMNRFTDVSTLGQLREFVNTVKPRIFHTNYCYFAWTAAAVEGLDCHRVLDTHDLISRRLTLNKELVRLCGGRRPTSTSEVPGSAHVPERMAALRYNMIPQEILHLMQFDTVLMISPSEAASIKPMMARDSVRPLEMFMPYSPAVRISSDNQVVRAVFTGGNNIYNLMGAAAIRNHILPYVEAHSNDDISFSVRMAGDVCYSVQEHARLDLLGRIVDIDTAYMDVDFALCPIPAGTGQNVKMVEALSHGIPVIAYSEIGRSANIVSNVNGMLANDTDEMREIVAALVNDTDRRRELAHSTRQWAREQFSQSAFLKSLHDALATTGFRFSKKLEVELCH